LFNALLAAAQQRGIPLLVDHKPKSRVDCTGATVIKLNHKEACDLAGAAHENGEGIARIGSQLSNKYKSEIVVTRAEKGVSIFSKDGRASTIQTKARRVADVSGAGDTFLAALTLALVSGAGIEDAVHIGNHAAGIKVGKVGAVPVTIDELRSDLQHA
jgi:D-beta-D-heptose 7-phosphate kinase/D-beta-D-heptose 1-phosphate adenosyltransferase